MFTKERLEIECHRVYSNGRGAKEEDEATKERLEIECHRVYSNGRGAKEEDEATKGTGATWGFAPQTRGRHGDTVFLTALSANFNSSN